MANFNLMNRGGPRWTASDYSNQAFSTMPYVEMVEYTQEYSQILQSIGFWEEKIENDFSDPYRGLYLGTPTGNMYRLPFFSEYDHIIGQNWQENQGPLGEQIKGLTDKVEQVAKVFKPSAGIVYPKSWAGVNESSYDVSFDLINTVDPDNDIAKNIQLKQTLIKQNLHIQHNVLTITPPCIYEVLIPGIRWSPVAVISGLTVTNKGTLTKNQKYGVVPDAWGITITIRELINESNKIYSDAITNGIRAAGVPGMSVSVFASR